MGDKRAVATAPAKIILCGEHAVVYGVPAIAVPVLSLQATATVQTADGDFVIASAQTGERFSAEDRSHPLVAAVHLALRQFHLSKSGFHIHLTSDIPIASGLGSGAAVTAAILKAILRYHQCSTDLDRINGLVYEIEKMHHGTPSGIDNTVVVYQQPVYFVKEKPIQRLELGGALHILVADTGQPASTRKTVAHVADLHHADPERIEQIFIEIERLVDEARQALRTGDAPQLGDLMTRNHHFLQQLEVSTPQLDGLVDAAIGAGALGAKLSGGGGGGNMIVLVTPDQINTVQRALIAAGAARVFSTQLGA